MTFHIGMHCKCCIQVPFQTLRVVCFQCQYVIFCSSYEIHDLQQFASVAFSRLLDSCGQKADSHVDVRSSTLAQKHKSMKSACSFRLQLLRSLIDLHKSLRPRSSGDTGQLGREFLDHPLHIVAHVDFRFSVFSMSYGFISYPIRSISFRNFL